MNLTLAPNVHSLITTDKGGEFNELRKNSGGDVHVYADPDNKNGLAVVDSAVKHLKRDYAAEVGKAPGRKC